MAPLPVVAPYVGLPWVSGLFSSSMVGLLVVLGEINRLSGDVLDSADHVWPFSQLMGPARLLSPGAAGWTTDFSEDDSRLLLGLLGAYVVVDAVFIATYLLFALWILRDRPESLGSRFRWARYVVVVVAAVDGLEDVLALVVQNQRTAGSPGKAFVFLVGLASCVKWALVLAAAVLLLQVTLSSSGGKTVRAALRRGAMALWVQRFSVLAIAPVIALSAVPGPNLLDQLPDAQRQWFDGGDGLWHFALSGVALLVLVLALFFLGRWRSDQVWRESRPDAPANSKGAVLWLWFVAPAVLLVVAFARDTAAPGTVSWSSLWLFLLVPIVVVAVSWYRRVWQLPTVDLRPLGPTSFTVIRTGDVIAVLAVAFAGIGLLRSLTAPVTLSIVTGRSAPGTLWMPLALYGGALLTTLPWAAQWPLLRWLHRRATGAGTPCCAANVAAPGKDTSAPRLLGVRFVLGGATVVVFVALALVPLWWVQTVGMLASAVLALASLVIMVGVASAIVRDTKPPELFYACGFRLHSAPVVALFVLAALLATLPGTGLEVHGVQGRAANLGSSVDRPTVEVAFRDWLNQPNPCRVVVSVGATRVGLRPMLLVAAEGGGIRAAYWTALGMEQIGTAGQADGPTPGTRCGAAATLLSGGASGGAVGLTVSRFSQRPVTQVTAMSDPDALGTAAIGLFTRDVLAGSTGITLPDFDAAFASPPLGVERGTWLDRAALMEDVWQLKAEGLSHPFLERESTTAPASEGLVGQLVLTSTVVDSGCRALVSQLDLTPSTSEALRAGDPGCSAATGPAPYSLDLFDLYGPAHGDGTSSAGGAQKKVVESGTAQGSGAPGCLGAGLTAATAAMLASRFPYVTPSGVVGPCQGLTQQQLVDGGYTENSGLGTLVDLSADWLPLVRNQNETIVANVALGGDRVVPGDIVVPIVVYLDNTLSNDVVQPPATDTRELQVPLVATGTGGQAQKQPPALLQRASAVTSDEQICGKTDICLLVGAKIKTEIAHRVVIVRPSTSPNVTASLGWVLSEASRTTMRDAMTAQRLAKCGDPVHQDSGACANGYGSLYDLLRFLNGGLDQGP